MLQRNRTPRQPPTHKRDLLSLDPHSPATSSLLFTNSLATDQRAHSSARRPSRRASPSTRLGTAASAAPSCTPCKASSAPTRSLLAPSATAPPTRSYDRLSDALKQIIDARELGDIHFRTADLQGAVLPKKVAHWAAKHPFERMG